jgi:N utilization substance protein A
MPSPIYQAIKQISEEKNIPIEIVIKTVESALAAAYRKDFGEKNQNIQVEFNPETGESRVFDVKEVVPDELAAKEEERRKKIEEERQKGIKPTISEEKTAEEEKEKRFNPKLHITLSEAKKIKADAQIGEIIRTELEVPSAYGRMAAQTAKQVITQKLKEAEREILYNEFKAKEGELIMGVVQRREGKVVLVDLGKITAIMPQEEQVEKEKYFPGSRIKVYVLKVEATTKGPQVTVSRAHPEVLKKFFSLEIPEISNGVVEIKAIAREAGSRSKVAVWSNDPNVDPIGACVGQNGVRIQTIISELGGEKVDIILWDQDPSKFIANALAPVKIANLEINEKEKTALATVRPDQLSLAIGKGGQNVRLAAKLTGWKINIKEEEKEEEKEKKSEKEEKES